MATKRLIDPERYETILQRFEEHLTAAGKLEAAEAVKSLIKGLKIAPTVDAVEVVRCKDCKKWYRHTKVDRERGDCRRYETTKHENGYCDRGERRTDG